MLRLILSRHAKSDRSLAIADYERPLNERGLENAKWLGKIFLQQEILPDLILSSGAKRAWSTANLIAERLGALNQLHKEDKIYEASPGDLLSLVQACSPAHRSLMLTGHNPGMERLASMLTGASLRMPTGAVVCIDVHALAWTDIRPEACQLRWMIIPRMWHYGEE